jgi:formate-dependent nitrite reductase membrane component NrfD
MTVRYPDSVDPVKTNGRDVDTAMASLDGEAAQQRAGRADHVVEWTWPEIGSAETTYYERPLLKRSVWSVDIPLYYFLGGTAGAALTLGAAVQWVSPRGRHPLRRLSTVCHWTGIVGSTAGAAFLIHDLGRPARFLMMMRVFRPTSPMNMGVWILGGAAPAAIATGLLIDRKDWLGRVGEATGYVSGVFGAALAGYTGVLVANSAVPVWQAARRWMAPLFMASSAASAASAVEVWAQEPMAQRVALVFGTAARVAELAAAQMVERAAGEIPKVAEPLRQGPTGRLWKAASALTLASLGLGLAAGRNRKARVAAGVLGMAGSLCLRFAVHYATNASAEDPRASFRMQRAE